MRSGCMTSGKREMVIYIILDVVRSSNCCLLALFSVTKGNNFLNSSFLFDTLDSNPSIFIKHNGGENMSRVYTIKTRLPMDGVLGDYLKDYITFYSRLSRVIFRDIINIVITILFCKFTCII